jgi:nitroreductase
MLQEVMNCIRSRRSIRKFTDREITPEELDTLLEAATWAPSGGNSQSWLFTAITDRRALAKLNETIRQAFLAWTPDDEYPAKRKAKVNAKNENYNYFHYAPVLIIASNVPDYQNAMADCSTALQNIFLAATAMGLGSCWINQLRWLREEAPVREYLAALGLPKEHVICGSAAIGHPGHTPPAPGRKGGTIKIVTDSVR